MKSSQQPQNPASQPEGENPYSYMPGFMGQWTQGVANQNPAFAAIFNALGGALNRGAQHPIMKGLGQTPIGGLMQKSPPLRRLFPQNNQTPPTV